MGAGMMKLPFRISAESLKETYNQVRIMMNGNENIIFEAMNALSLERNSSFSLPIDSNEYEQKHREIEERLEHPAFGRGIETAMRLMEEIILKVRPLGGVPGYSTHDLLEKMKFRT